MKKFIPFLLIVLSTTKTFAQDSQPEMADIMRSNGKIYVVVATIVVIFIGIVLYLISIDRRISKLEKEQK
jgi:CcmD family protein